jgi:hypothetical protein
MIRSTYWGSVLNISRKRSVLFIRVFFRITRRSFDGAAEAPKVEEPELQPSGIPLDFLQHHQNEEPNEENKEEMEAISKNRKKRRRRRKTRLDAAAPF